MDIAALSFWLYVGFTDVVAPDRKGGEVELHVLGCRLTY